MSISRSTLLAASVSLAALFATATIAQAQTRQKQQKGAEPTRTITVKKRSFVDSGQVVRVGAESNYVQAGQYLNRNNDTFNPGNRYGAETLPGRFSIPRQPLFNF